MRITVKAVQIFVGVLFIISGLVKANDPLGLAYKMEEYFELWSAAAGSKGWLVGLFNFFHNKSLALSVFMITLEIVTGVALLIGWMKRTILYLLLLLIIFFTFLTGYAYLSGKFTNCGCFGDCLPITPLTSFIKDIVLLFLILILLFGQQYIKPLFTNRTRLALLTLSLIGTLLLQWYVLNYLPLVDCLPFKKGNNIEAQTRPPAGAVSDSIAMRFVYEKGGKRYEFAPENLPADFETYTYVDRIDKVVRKGNAVPPIKGFILKGLTDIDSTAAIYAMPDVVLIFMMDLKDADDWMRNSKEILALNQKIPVHVVTAASITRSKDALVKNGLGAIPVYNCDNTAVKTAARTDPAIYYLKKGTIVKKWSGKEIDKAVNHLINHRS